MKYEWIDGMHPSPAELAIEAGRFGATNSDFDRFLEGLEYRIATDPVAFYSYVTNYDKGCTDKRKEYALCFVNEIVDTKTLTGVGYYIGGRSGNAEALNLGVWIIKKKYSDFNFARMSSKEIVVTGNFDEVAVIHDNYVFSAVDDGFSAIVLVPVPKKED